MRRLVATAVVLACTLAAAQQKPAPKGTSKPQTAPSVSSASKGSSADAARISDIRRLLAITGSRSMVNDMKATMMEQFKQASPSLPPAMFDEMLAEMKAEDLEEAIIPIYLKHFTASDIKQLIAFYQSPFGKKVTRAMPQIIQESNQAGISWGQGVIEKIATKWHNEGKLTEQEFEQLVGPVPPPR